MEVLIRELRSAICTHFKDNIQQTHLYVDLLFKTIYMGKKGQLPEDVLQQPKMNNLPCGNSEIEDKMWLL